MTTISIFLTFPSKGAQSRELADWFGGAPLSLLAAKATVTKVNIYQPSAGKVAVFNDEAKPPLMVQIDVSDLKAANELLADDDFARVVAKGKHSALVEVFAPHHYPVQGETSPRERTATISLMVRYFRPIDNEDKFVANYVNGHPAVLGTLPAVRNVLCYLPVAYQNPHGINLSDAFIGNEVVFDDLDALNTALRSEVMPTLIDHARHLPRCKSTHVAMDRQQVYPS